MGLSSSPSHPLRLSKSSNNHWPFCILYLPDLRALAYIPLNILALPGSILTVSRQSRNISGSWSDACTWHQAPHDMGHPFAGSALPYSHGFCSPWLLPRKPSISFRAQQLFSWQSPRADIPPRCAPPLPLPPPPPPPLITTNCVGSTVLLVG